MKTHSRFSVTMKFQIFWSLFIGIGAVFGATGMLIKPDGSLMGMQVLIPYFQVLPFADTLFQNYIFPGIALLLVNGIPNLLAFILILKRKKSGVVLGGVLGITLMAWICIQFVIFPANVMDISFFIFGFIQAVTGYASYVFYSQENIKFEKTDYSEIGSKKDELVVYFSRMGYTKRIAYELANGSGAEIYELKSTERTDGTVGFWWCGRYGMHSWEMPIEEPKIDLKKYTKIIVCSPVWVFGLSAPVKAFCSWASGRIENCDYVLVHHQGLRYDYIADEMDEILKTHRANFKSIQCHIGKYKLIENRRLKNAEN